MLGSGGARELSQAYAPEAGRGSAPGLGRASASGLGRPSARAAGHGLPPDLGRAFPADVGRGFPADVGRGASPDPPPLRAGWGTGRASPTKPSPGRTLAPDVVVGATTPDVIDDVLAASAAVGRRADVLSEPSAVIVAWRRAEAVFLDVGLAEALVAHRPPRRTGVYLVGDDGAALAALSVPLGAEVVVLPAGVGLLAGLLADDPAAPRGRTVAVIGGCGGVGASTLAAGLAFACHQGGQHAALVDLDVTGGGLDLLLGAERVAGWRWPQLAFVGGRVGDLGGGLPQIEGVTLVSMARGEALDVGREPLATVLGALVRHHDLVVLDPGRSASGVVRDGVAAAGVVVLIVRGDVRGVAAARETLQTLEVAEPLVLVRPMAGTGVVLGQVEQALGLPVMAELPHERRLVEFAELGEPPVRLGRRPWGRAVAAVARGVMSDE